MAYNSDTKMMTVMFFGGGARKQPVSGGGGGYQGPLDIVPGAVVAYGVRALSSSLLGQPIFRLSRNSDNAESDFSADSTTGDAPTSSIAAWLGGATGFFVKFYDQSGNANNLGLGDVMPLYVENVQGGKCGASDVLTNDGDMAGDSTISINGALSVALVAGANSHIQGLSSEFFFGNLNSDTYFRMTDGVNTAGADVDGDPSTYASYCGAWEFGSRSFFVNSSAETTTTLDSGGAVGAITPTPYLVLTSTSGSSGDAKFQEVIIYTSKLSDGNLTSISDNQQTYYSL